MSERVYPHMSFIRMRDAEVINNLLRHEHPDDHGTVIARTLSLGDALAIAESRGLPLYELQRTTGTWTYTTDIKDWTTGQEFTVTETVEE